MKIISMTALVALVAVAGYFLWPSAEPTNQSDQSAETNSMALAKVIVPETLSDTSRLGKQAFDVKCASCHGENAAGQKDIAPPLIHKIYEPNHHGDEAFQRAAAEGVRAHHWPFGNMPPVDGITRGDVKMIVAYIRELQRANGIK